MKILLVGINARYVHTNLAIRCLREVLKAQENAEWEVCIREFSINEHPDKIAGEIFAEKPDVLGFSCYIWNITFVKSLVRRLRPVLPDAFILAGGPEVSFDCDGILTEVPELDAVVAGEAEGILPLLLQEWAEGNPPSDIHGVVRKQQRGTACLPNREGKARPNTPDLNLLPNPYAEQEDFRGKLVYIETSRGCPYNCAFCISSTFKGVRFLAPERLRPVLRQLFAGGARTVKFVDRTFNASKTHGFQVLDIFREEAEQQYENSGQERTHGWTGDIPRAHCEMAGELLDEEWLRYLKDYPAGMIQLEIGVQSTHPPALKAIRRAQKFKDWKEKVRFLQHDCGIPVHLDLIAGLPYEGWTEFRRSFDEVIDLRPDHLQLGFLKVLKGSGIREKSAGYGLVYCPDPPYTILKTRDLSHEQVLDLVRIEEMLERYYNSGKFRFSLEAILVKRPSPFDFFDSLARYWHSQGWFQREWSSRALFENIWEFLIAQPDDLDAADIQLWREALRFDYFVAERPGQIPDFLQRAEETVQDKGWKEEIRKDPVWRNRIPESEGMDKRQWTRATAIEYFERDIPTGTTEHSPGRGGWYLFYYSRKPTQYFKAEAPKSI
ncbi:MULTISPECIES: B12-binding domain-containing radical SAM protein [unclassified Dehalobacter]|uniref:B12-binding domain-containing radical SAM protein n=1 Tax=unclassified Dehalobacter TaxID=2635733 RepID=UPI000E6CA527|nr:MULTISPECIES: B12-binding domain-containing radical SAM protein [unclassified Dehalobacter]RJE47481.1 B12-binding domain-containing radical SAM protein [Dehalobacter sp. MCB1]TCX48707.1 B12-binding domain-containing radical SAM protein [Dehalobacter sp. 14DCB1]TCX56245.1 B12-binding domain-containing radical SAM protein [Dehalobacter sp. 12DCB1]